MSSTRSCKGIPMDIISHLTARERLLVAQAVYEYGSNAWPDISSVLSKHPLITRPKGFFSPQACQTIYDYLMGEAGYECSDETHAPHAQLNLKLAQKHYRARVIELRTLILEEEEKFKSLAVQIDDIREGRWDEEIAKELGIHPQVANAGSEELVKKANILNEAPFQQIEEDSSPILDEEPMVVSAEPDTSIVRMEDQQEVPISISQPLPEPQYMPTIDISEEENMKDDQILPTPSQVEDVGSALEEIKLSAPLDENELQDSMQQVAPTGPAPPTSVSREERTQEELKAIEALEELSRLGLDIVPMPVQASVSQPIVKIDDATAQINTSQIDKDAVTPNDTISDITVPEVSTPPFSKIENQPSIPLIFPSVIPGKRKISDIDFASPDPSRGKKPRDESVPTDDEAVPGRRRPRATMDSSTPSTKRFQAVIAMLHSQISQHRNGNIFHSPIRESEAPDYHEIVKRPMDLKTIKTRVKDGIVANSDDYQREVYLMFANAMMYNRPKSDIARMSREMLIESEEHIRSFRATEDLMSRGKR